MQMRSVFPPPAPGTPVGDRPRIAQRLARAARAAGARFRSTLIERWPRMRRQLPTDLLILTWLALAAQAFSVAWVMTDSVHTSVALVLKGATVRPGELAVFGYSGESITGYYQDDKLFRLQQALGQTPSSLGPRKGDGFVKYLIGIPGDRIEVEGDRVYLTTARGRLDMGRCKPASRHGAPLAPIAPQVIPAGMVYVWAPHVDALDSRYAVMGLVPRSAIVGKAVPLW
jgi:conjugal transfer pilin signal peptidase TrbI